MIDSTLLFAALFGSITYFALPGALLSWQEWYQLTDLTALALTIIALVFRKKVSLTIKASLFFLILFNLIISGAAEEGLFSADKVFFVLIPFYGLLFFDSQRTIIIYLVAVMAYLVIGYFHINSTLLLPTDFVAGNKKISFWVESVLLVSIVSAIVSIFTTQYNQRLSRLIEELQNKNQELREHREELRQQVQERTQDLEKSNETLDKTNLELNNRNDQFNDQKEELQETLDDLKEVQSRLVDNEKMASLGVLTAGVSHELNNPLNFIKGGYHGLVQHFETPGVAKSEDIDDLLSSIQEGVERAANIVNGLNRFSRENDTYDEECNLHEIVDNCLHMLHNMIKNRIEIKKNYNDEEITIKGNVGKLHQVFVNLITNACQAIEKEGEIEIITEIDRVKKQALVQLRDNGSGITEENLKKILEPFFTTKDPGKGTGLGLSISNSIIQAHNGNLAFESKPGAGTTASVTIPL